MSVLVTYIDPNADGTAHDWNPSTGTAGYAVVDDAVRQPTTPNTADFISTANAARNEDLAFPDTATYTNGDVYKLWVYGNTSGETNRVIQYAVSTDNGANWSTATTLFTTGLASQWKSADISSSITSQAQLNGLQIRLLHTSTGSGSGTATVYAVYIEQDIPVLARMSWSEIATKRATRSYDARLTGQATASRTNDVRLTPSSYLFADTFEGPLSKYHNVVLGDSPTAYWRLDQLSGTTATDSAGTNNGTYTGGYTLNQPGILQYKGVLFNNSVTGYVSVPDATAIDLGNGPFTLEAWIRRTNTTDGGYIFSKGTAYLVSISPAGYIEFYPGTPPQIAHASVPITDTTTFHHVVITKNGSTSKVYLDGVDVTVTNTDSTLADNAGSLSIGGWSGGNTLSAVVTNAAIYKSVLSSTAIAAHYETGINAQLARWIETTATISLDTTQKHGSSRSLKTVTNNVNITEGVSLSNAPPTTAGLLIPVTPGATATFATWIYANAGTYNLRVLIDEYDSSLTYQGTSTTYFTPPATTWTQYSVTRTLSGAAAYINLRVLTSNLNSTPTAATFWIDDVTLDQTPFSSIAYDARLTGQATSSQAFDARITAITKQLEISWTEVQTGISRTNVTYDARISGQGITSRVQDTRITAQQISSNPWSARLTGQASSSYTQDARLTAVNPSVQVNTTQDARLTGQAATSVVYSAALTGQASSNQAWDARVTGKLTSSLATDARTTGQASSNVTYDARLTGQNTTSVIYDARLTGQASSNATYDARQFGQTGSSVAYDARQTAQATTSIAYDVRETGQLSSNVTSDARLSAQATTALATDARIIGSLTSNRTSEARLSGQATDNVALDARITGVIVGTVRSARVYYAEMEVPYSTAQQDFIAFDARIFGLGQDSLAIDARITSGVTDSVAYDARLIGRAQDQLGADVRVTAGSQSLAEIFAFLGGRIIDSAVYTARVTGQLPSSAAFDARLTGQVTPSTERDARLTSYDQTSRTNDVRITGVFGSSTNNRVIVTWAEMTVPNPMGASVTYAARITGQDSQSVTWTVNMLSIGMDAVAYDARLTSQLDTSIEAFTFISGQASSQVTYDARLGGQATAILDTDARLTGVSTNAVAYDARTFGAVIQTTTQDAFITGQDSASTAYSARITASLNQSSRSQDARLTATALASSVAFDARQIAALGSSQSYAARIFGLGLDFVAYDVRLTAQATSSIAQDARLTAQATSLTEIDARLTARDITAITNVAAITARLDSSVAYDARLVGKAGPIVVYDARLTGQSTSSVVYDAHITSSLSNSVAYDTRITAYDQSAVTYVSATIGQAQSVATWNARLTSAGTSTLTLDSFVTAQAQTAAIFVTRLAGQALHQTEYDARLVGIDHDFWENDAFITGFGGDDMLVVSVKIHGRKHHKPIRYEEAQLKQYGSRTRVQHPAEGTRIKPYTTNSNM